MLELKHWNTTTTNLITNMGTKWLRWAQIQWTKGRIVQHGSIFHHTLRLAHNLKLINCLFLEFSHLIFLDQDWPQVTQTIKSETVVEVGYCLCLCVQFLGSRLHYDFSSLMYLGRDNFQFVWCFCFIFVRKEVITSKFVTYLTTN